MITLIFSSNWFNQLQYKQYMELLRLNTYKLRQYSLRFPNIYVSVKSARNFLVYIKVYDIIIIKCFYCGCSSLLIQRPVITAISTIHRHITCWHVNTLTWNKLTRCLKKIQWEMKNFGLHRKYAQIRNKWKLQKKPIKNQRSKWLAQVYVENGH